MRTKAAGAREASGRSQDVATRHGERLGAIMGEQSFEAVASAGAFSRAILRLSQP
jgi:hypothetical protein